VAPTAAGDPAGSKRAMEDETPVVADEHQDLDDGDDGDEGEDGNQSVLHDKRVLEGETVVTFAPPPPDNFNLWPD